METVSSRTYEELRWSRAASWALGQSTGPWGQLEGAEWEEECRRIEALKDRILEIGEDAAWAEYMEGRKMPNATESDYPAEPCPHSGTHFYELGAGPVSVRYCRRESCQSWVIDVGGRFQLTGSGLADYQESLRLIRAELDRPLPGWTEEREAFLLGLGGHASELPDTNDAPVLSLADRRRG